MKRHLLLIFSLWIAVSAVDAAEPERIVVERGDRKDVFYQYQGKQYRAVELGELANYKTDVLVCITGKLANVQKTSLVLHSRILNDIRFKLTPLATVTAVSGNNVWLGGKLSDVAGQVQFSVMSVAKLADDLKLFASRFKSLQDARQAKPEDYYRLAWWLQEGERLSTGLTAEESRLYQAGTQKSYQTGVKEDMSDFPPKDDTALLARLDRYQAVVDQAAGVFLDGEADWYLTSCRKLLQDNRLAVTALKAKRKLEEQPARLLKAGICLFLGDIHQRFLHDQKTSGKLFLTGVRQSPNDPDLGRRLKALAFVKVDGVWMTPENARIRERENERLKMQEAERLKIEAREKAIARDRERLSAGVGMEQIRLVVDPLLGAPNEKNINELAKRIGELPEDVTRYLLWQIAALPGSVKVDSILIRGLNTDNPAIRQDTADLLITREMGVGLIINQLATEKDSKVAEHMVFALQQIPGKAAIDALIGVLGNDRVPAPTRNLAKQLLALETGQKLGDNIAKWRSWWNQRRPTFKRSP